jgi:hypothetical protein
MSLGFFLIGGGLGLLAGYLRWDEEYHAVLHLFPSKIFFGAWELIFSLALVAATCVMWRRAQSSKLARRLRMLFLLLAGTNLLYHFPFLFTIISRYRSSVFLQRVEVDASMFRRLMMEDSVMPQAVHFGLASFAVVGFALIGFALWSERRSGEEGPHTAKPEDLKSPDRDENNEVERVSDIGADAQRIVAWGVRLALGATLCQIPVGIWLVVKLSSAAQQRVLGADLVATGLLGISIMLSLGLMHHLAALAFGPPRKKNMIVAMAMLAVLITMMTGVLERL